jgi:glutamate-ammonia-ligase adenylyltransferase
MLKIGLRDILEIADIEKIMLEYSTLTGAILTTALRMAIEINKSKFEIDRLSIDYCLIALGKLGGNELNYSSDVDLIFFYEKEFRISKSINSSEFFENVVKGLINICSAQREEGYLYRTDFRLRPDGKFSPLSRSLDYYLLYYESRGRGWEKQMLLKSNLISGSEKLYSKFVESIQNFIYPRSLFASPHDLIFKFKEDHLTIYDQEKNIKHFRGGIRDIEFSIQALQLLNGGKNPVLRTPNTLQALTRLYNLNFISSKNLNRLNAAYIFFRRIENYLQLMDDKQKHELPDDRESYLNLVHFMKFSDLKKFDQELKKHRQNVKIFYDSIIGRGRAKNIILDSVKFKNSEAALINLHKLKTGLTLTVEKLHDSKISIEFENFFNNIFNYLKKSSAPDKTLNNLMNIISASKFPIFWYDLLQQKEFFNSVLTICEMSDMITNQLCMHRELRDFVLNGKVFLTFEDAIQFKNYDYAELKFLDFYLAFNFLIKKIKAVEVSSALSKFFDNSIQTVVEELIPVDSNIPEFIIIGMGSYGTKDLTLTSDLDLIFIYDIKNRKRKIDQNLFIAILKTIRQRFSQRQFFEIDSRLRPEGKISQLGWEINQFEKYVVTRMRIWEFQAYTKARLIYGSERLFLRVKQILINRLKEYKEQILFEEIKLNLRKIKSVSVSPPETIIDFKTTNGGILDVQFLIQFLLLTQTRNVVQLDPRIDSSIINLKRNKILSADTSSNLLKNYNLLRNFVLLCQLTSDKKKSTLNLTGEQIVLILKYFKLSSKEKAISYISRILNQNIRIKAELFC